MSWLDDLKRIQPHQNKQYAWYNPKRYDLGISEAIQAYAAPNTAMSDDLGSNWGSEPVAPNDVMNITTPQREWSVSNPVDNKSYSTGYGDEGYNTARDIVRSDRYKELQTIADKGGLNPAQETEWNNLNADSGGDGGSSGPSAEDLAEILRRQQEMARQRYATLMSSVESEYERAKRRRDEAMQALNKRKKEFGDLRDEDLFSIRDTFEGAKGGARRTHGDLTQMAGNRARAMGRQNMSNVMGVPSRLDEMLHRQMGNINTTKSQNEREAERLYGKRQDWATAQGQKIRDTFEQAGDRRRQAANLNALDYTGNLNALENQMRGYADQLVNARTALNNIYGGVGNYKASPYQTNLSGLNNVLQAQLPQVAQRAQNAQNQAVNITDASQLQKILDWQNKVPGGSLYV